MENPENLWQCHVNCSACSELPILTSNLNPTFQGCWGCIRGYIWTYRVCGYLWIVKASHVANLNQVSCPALISSQLVQGLFAGHNLISSSFRKKRQTAKIKVLCGCYNVLICTRCHGVLGLGEPCQCYIKLCLPLRYQCPYLSSIWYYHM